MRVFLRHKQTRFYCAPANRWAATTAQALLFISVRHAAKFAFDQNLPQAEIVVWCDVLEQEVTVPLIPEWCDLHEPRPAAD